MAKIKSDAAVSAPAPSLLGTKLSHYRILEEIGEGGMANVYLAFDESLSRRVALKFLKPEILQRANYAHKILAEARAAAAVDHPFVCKVYETCETDVGIFIVLEYVSGTTVRDRLREGWLPSPVALKYACEVAEALVEVHNRGIVHQDLKPANIMITRHDHVKLMDFGLARQFQSPADAQACDTAISTAILEGTPCYMAPEQLRGEPAGIQSDLFALGLVLHEMLTGRHPFLKDAMPATVGAILHEDYSKVPKGQLEPDLIDIIDRALRKSPNERYATAEEFRSRLVQALDALKTPGRASRAKQIIAILPFEDLSAEKDQEYFCDGLAEELLNMLTSFDELQVISRTSSFQFRNSRQDIRTIGRTLNATAVLEGSVRKAGSRLRITATLTNVRDGYPMWSQKYDCGIHDILAIQELISQAIANRLKLMLGQTNDEKVSETKLPVKPEAYELYLRARYFWNQRKPASLLESIKYYKMACEADPTYSKPHAGLAVSYVTLSIYGVIPPVQAMTNAREAAEQALSHDQTLVDAIAALGCIASVFDFRWDKAESYFKQAIRLDPKNALAHQWYAINLLAPFGRFEDARFEIERALEIDPASPLVLATAGVQYYFARRYSQAVDNLMKAFQLDPELAVLQYFIAQVHLARGRHSEAIEYLKAASFLSNRDSESLALLAYAYAASGNRDVSVTLLEELKQRATSQYVSPVLLSQINIGLGNIDCALDLLQEACSTRATDLIWIAVRPVFDPIRRDARFVEICTRLGLPAMV